MTDYRRLHTPGGTWFFTVNLAQRRNNALLVHRVNALREAIGWVKAAHPFRIDAMVILPDHLHAIWTLPADDCAFGMRWSLIKARFSRSIPSDEFRRESRRKRGERGIWQRRFWEHQIRSEADMQSHIDYIHFNPLKHRLVSRVSDWPFSSFHRFVRNGWCGLELNKAPADPIGGAGESPDKPGHDRCGSLTLTTSYDCWPRPRVGCGEERTASVAVLPRSGEFRRVDCQRCGSLTLTTSYDHSPGPCRMR